MNDKRDAVRRAYEESKSSDSARDEVSAEPEEAANPGQRSTQQELWVDIQIRQAMRQGEFDNLPGSGKPIEGLGQTHDPDWFAKRMIQREQLTGLGPPAIMLRKDDAELDDLIDREGSEAGVRRVVEDFNHRVVEARRQLLGGPPVITATRDVDEQVDAWRLRREERRARQRRSLAEDKVEETAPKRRRWRAWWSRR
jgi:hypothetical protein